MEAAAPAPDQATDPAPRVLNEIEEADYVFIPRRLYACEIAGMWNIPRLVRELATREQCIQFAEEKGLIKDIKVCNTHRLLMIKSLDGNLRALGLWYGLILPGNKNEKPAPLFQAARNVFGEDSDSDEEAGKKKTIQPATNVKKQIKLVQEKALMEDPTVYQYDELYDDIEHKKKMEKMASKEDKKPKYIEKLIESANKRKREHDRRLERQVQKEREKEGSEFADKESFVTSAYKKKLEELREEEEREKREEYLENIGDVTKQKDLGGFYRHLYEQKLGSEPKVKEEIKKSAQKEPKEEKKDKEDVSKRTEPKSKHNKIPGSPSTKKNRNYRKRKLSSEMAAHDLSEGEIVSEEEDKLPTLEDIKTIKKTQLTVTQNIDADSDFSDDSSDSEHQSKKKKENKEIDHAKEDKVLEDKGKPKEEFKAPFEKEKSAEPEKESSSPIPGKENEEPKAPLKPKVNIWEKRTVGVVFEEALKRYYERKAARSR